MIFETFAKIFPRINISVIKNILLKNYKDYNIITILALQCNINIYNSPLYAIIFPFSYKNISRDISLVESI